MVQTQKQTHYPSLTTHEGIVQRTLSIVVDNELQPDAKANPTPEDK